MKPIPVSWIDAAICSGLSMMLTPSASRTSALPDFDDTPRLPCFATFAPAAATTNIDAVEMLNVCDESPPVPTMSTKLSSLPGTTTLVESSRMTCAAAVISPTVSFFTRRPVMIAAVISGEISPAMIWRISESISSWKISRCSIVRCRASCGVMAIFSQWESRKFLSIWCPCSVRIASGWNCTPSTGSVLWRTPMISPSSDSAVTRRQSGSESRSITSE